MEAGGPFQTAAPLPIAAIKWEDGQDPWTDWIWW
jgi:hypothetical protein